VNEVQRHADSAHKRVEHLGPETFLEAPVVDAIGIRQLEIGQFGIRPRG
jgi:hypothetical protein